MCTLLPTVPISSERHAILKHVPLALSFLCDGRVRLQGGGDPPALPGVRDGQPAEVREAGDPGPAHGLCCLSLLGRGEAQGHRD